MNASLNSLNDWLGEALEHDLMAVDRLLVPPFPYLYPAAELLSAQSGWFLGAQNCASEPQGAFTGETSVSMLKDVGASYVLIGHSERRQGYAETDEIVLEKVKLAVSEGLKVILCVGETALQRQANTQQAVLSKQLELLLSNIDAPSWANISIAYEPVWAIGSGESASPEQAQQMHEFIRSLLSAVSSEVSVNTHIIYGGSVNENNAQELFAQADIDGALIGGASLQAESFIKICKLAG